MATYRPATLQRVAGSNRLHTDRRAGNRNGNGHQRIHVTPFAPVDTVASVNPASAANGHTASAAGRIQAQTGMRENLTELGRIGLNSYAQRQNVQSTPKRAKNRIGAQLVASVSPESGILSSNAKRAPRRMPAWPNLCS